MTLTFHALDNRTRSVTSGVTIWNNPENNSEKTQRFNPDGSPVKAFADQSISLDPNGADLPWEKDVTLPDQSGQLGWLGVLADGTHLPNGSYFMCLQITDGDGNPSPGANPNLPTNSCTNFTITNRIGRPTTSL